jgi:hypothetical protein
MAKLTFKMKLTQIWGAKEGHRGHVIRMDPNDILDFGMTAVIAVIAIGTLAAMFLRLI